MEECGFLRSQPSGPRQPPRVPPAQPGEGGAPPPCEAQPGPPRPGLAGLLLGLGQVGPKRAGAGAAGRLSQTDFQDPACLGHPEGRAGGAGSDREPITCSGAFRAGSRGVSVCVCARARISGDFCDSSSQIPESERRGGGRTTGGEGRRKIGGGRGRRREQPRERAEERSPGERAGERAGAGAGGTAEPVVARRRRPARGGMG